MTLYGLEITNIAKKIIVFLFFYLHYFLFFKLCIFRIIYGRTCYGTTVQLSFPDETRRTWEPFIIQ